MSQDQLGLNIDVAIQYQYNVDAFIPIILMLFGTEDNYLSTVQGIMQSSIIATCGKFDAEQYYTERGFIETTFYQNLLASITRSQLDLYVSSLQFRNIDFPGDYATAINQKQLTQQEAITQMNSRTSQLIVANTTLITATQQAQILIVQANNTANINIQQALVQEQIVATQWEQFGIALLNYKQNLNLNDTELVNYAKNEIIRKSVNPVINIEFN